MKQFIEKNWFPLFVSVCAILSFVLSVRFVAAQVSEVPELTKSVSTAITTNNEQTRQLLELSTKLDVLSVNQIILLQNTSALCQVTNARCVTR